MRTVTVDHTAAIGDRMIALVLDAAMLFALIGSIIAIGAYKWDLVPLSATAITRNEALAVVSSGAAIGFLYFWLMEGLAAATLGKMLIGLRLECVDGSDITLKEAIVRTLFRPIDGIGLYFVGFVVAILSRRRQRIGDHVAGTYVLNEPYSTGIRAGALVLWIALIAGPLFAVWKVVEPVRTGIEQFVLQRTVDSPTLLAPTPPNIDLSLRRFDWLATPDGPVVETATFKPGDRTWAGFSVIGYGRDEEGRINLLIESLVVDPSGTPVARPTVSTTVEAGEIDVERVDAIEIPEDAPPGDYELKIRVRDLSRNRDATFRQAFHVDAPDVAAAPELEVRNFVFSIAAGGFSLEAPVFDVGETAHYRYEVHGLQLVDDRVDVSISYRLTGPDGRAIYTTRQWRTVNDGYGYHPPSFFIEQDGSISLPSDAAHGIYTIEHVVTDNLAKKSTKATGQFRLR